MMLYSHLQFITVYKCINEFHTNIFSCFANCEFMLVYLQPIVSYETLLSINFIFSKFCISKSDYYCLNSFKLTNVYPII